MGKYFIMFFADDNTLFSGTWKTCVIVDRFKFKVHFHIFSVSSVANELFNAVDILEIYYENISQPTVHYWTKQNSKAVGLTAK